MKNMTFAQFHNLSGDQQAKAMAENCHEAEKRYLADWDKPKKTVDINWNDPSAYN